LKLQNCILFQYPSPFSSVYSHPMNMIARLDMKHATAFAWAVIVININISIIPTNAFSPFPSSFNGRVNSVCSRAELTTELSCPPSSSLFGRRGTNMSMPPFLKKLGLKKPGNEDSEPTETTATAVLQEDKVSDSTSISTSAVQNEECEIQPEKELTETEKLLKQVKEAGTAGVISYALWELAFWALSVPVCIFAYYELFGHFPDFTNQEDLSKLGGEAFAFVNFARFAVPLRIGLALSTTPWIQDNVVDTFFNKNKEDNCEQSSE